jgi:hypothetical protein
VLLRLISLLGLAFASMFTTLALGLAIVTLLLLVVPVWVAVLMLHHADFISIVLIRAMADRVCLILSDNGCVHFA